MAAGHGQTIHLAFIFVITILGVGVAVLLLSGLLLWTVVMDCLVLLQISLQIKSN